MTIVENDKGEFVPICIQNGRCMCINYKKLIEVTRKDHFPLTLLRKNDKKLARKSYFYFLDSCSGIYQILIACNDQNKSIICNMVKFHFWMSVFRKIPFELYNAPPTCQRCLLNILSNFVGKCIEVFIDDLMVYGNDF